MSLIQTVIDRVESRRSATLDDLMQDLDGFTREQVASALAMAAFTRQIQSTGCRREKGVLGSLPAIYTPKPRPMIRWVFDLAA